MLLRASAPSAIEVYLLRRNARSAFAPNAYVFPGGTVDADDRTPQALAQMLHPDPRTTPELARAALRELFEEAGILLARDRTGMTASASAQERARINARELTLTQLLAQRDLQMNATDLVLFSRWITPPTEPRRYDTAFFLAAAPQSQSARADTQETYDGLWIAPEQALQRAREGSLYLVYPTIKHLERLARFRSVEDAIAFARSKPIVPIMPDDSPANGFSLPPELEGVW